MATAHGKLRRQQQLDAHAHRMRLAPSEPERVLWQALRGGQLGVQFRRQVVLHGFIVDFFAPAARLVVEVDFFAPAARLVVEVDGTHHARQRGADKRRDAAFAAAGVAVLRLPAQLVLSQIGLALQLVGQALR
jgi:very-short-patch-repair endonuclease